MQKNKLVWGVGVNDSESPVRAAVGGRQTWACPFYRAWANMLERCYSQRRTARSPTYVGCSVVPEWHTFSAFRSWMSTKVWDGLELDKDILVPGNKVYGPDTCAFVTKSVNSFLLDSRRTRGAFPVGVSWHATDKVFRARCSDPFGGKQEYLGTFLCPRVAHLAYAGRKLEHAERLAMSIADTAVAQALIARYKKQHVDAWSALTSGT